MGDAPPSCKWAVMLQRNEQLQRLLQVQLDSLYATLGSLSELYGVLRGSPDSAVEEFTAAGQNSSRRSMRSGHAIRVVNRDTTTTTTRRAVSTKRNEQNEKGNVIQCCCFAGHLENTQQFSLLARTSLVALHRVDFHHGRDYGSELHLRNAIEEHAQRADAFAYGYLMVPTETSVAALTTSVAVSSIVAVGPPLSNDDRSLQQTNLVFPRACVRWSSGSSSEAADGRGGAPSSHSHRWDASFDATLVRELLARCGEEHHYHNEEQQLTVGCNAMLRCAGALSIHDWTNVATAVSRLHFRHRPCIAVTSAAEDLAASTLRFDGNSTALPVSASCCRHRWFSCVRPVAIEVQRLCGGDKTTAAALFYDVLLSAMRERGSVSIGSGRWAPQELDVTLHARLLHSSVGYLVCRPVWVSLARDLNQVDTDDSVLRGALDDHHRQQSVVIAKQEEPVDGGSDYHHHHTVADRKHRTVPGDVKQVLSERVQLFLNGSITAFQIASHFQRVGNPYHITTAAEVLSRQKEIVAAMRHRCIARLETLPPPSLSSSDHQHQHHRLTALAQLLRDDSYELHSPSSSFSVEEDTRLLWCANDLASAHNSRFANTEGSGGVGAAASRCALWSVLSTSELALSFFFRTLAKASIPVVDSTNGHDTLGGGLWGASPFFDPRLSFRTAAQVSRRWAVLAPAAAPQESKEYVGSTVVDCCGGVRDVISGGFVAMPSLHISDDDIIPRPIAASQKTWLDLNTKFLAMFSLWAQRRLHLQGEFEAASEHGGGHVKWRGDVAFLERYVLEGSVSHDRLRTTSRYQFTTRVHQFLNVVVAPSLDVSARHAAAPAAVIREDAVRAEEEEHEDTPEALNQQVASRRRSAVWTPGLDAFLLGVVDRVQVPWRFEETPHQSGRRTTASQQQRRQALMLQPTVDDGECWWRYVAQLVQNAVGDGGSACSDNPPSSPELLTESFTSTQCYLRFSKLKHPSRTNHRSVVGTR
jgi:hypothetical protein